jgi:hypothetical protein
VVVVNRKGLTLTYFNVQRKEPEERLFSVPGQVDSSRMTNLSSDNLTLLVFMDETLSMLRKIRVLKLVQETVGVL